MDIRLPFLLVCLICIGLSSGQVKTTRHNSAEQTDEITSRVMRRLLDISGGVQRLQESMMPWPSVDLMSNQRSERWSDIKSTSGQRPFLPWDNMSVIWDILTERDIQTLRYLMRGISPSQPHDQLYYLAYDNEEAGEKYGMEDSNNLLLIRNKLLHYSKLLKNKRDDGRNKAFTMAHSSNRKSELSNANKRQSKMAETIEHKSKMADTIERKSKMAEKITLKPRQWSEKRSNIPSDHDVCRADYDAFLKPVTDLVLDIVTSQLCDAEDVPPYLVLVCSALDALDRPDSGMEPWGWQSKSNIFPN